MAGNDLPHNGPVQNLRTPNSETWAPGVVVSNNVVASGGLGGILFSGDNTGTQAGRRCRSGGLSTTPSTALGRRTTSGFGSNQNAGPTLLNNVVANLSNGIIVDGTSGTTVVGATLYWNNAFNAGGIPGGGLGDFPILATTSPFVNAAGRQFLPGGDLAADRQLRSQPGRSHDLRGHQDAARAGRVRSGHRALLVADRRPDDGRHGPIARRRSGG